MYALIDSSSALEEIYSQTLCSRQISRQQLNQLQLLDTVAALQPQQNRLIRRLLHASRRGWLNVVD